MSSRYKDALKAVPAFRNGIQRGDRPGLHDGKSSVHTTPLDVLGRAEGSLDLLADGGKFSQLTVCEGRGGLDVRFGFPVAQPPGEGRFASGHQFLAQSHHCLDDTGEPVGGHGVGGKQYARNLRGNHLLHHHGDGHILVAEAVFHAVRNRPVVVQRGETIHHSAGDVGGPYVQVAVLLPRKGGVGQVLRRGRRTHGKEDVRGIGRQSRLKLPQKFLRDEDIPDRLPDFGARPGKLRRGGGLQGFPAGRNHTGAKLPEGVGGDDKAAGHMDIIHGCKPDQIRSLAAGQGDIPGSTVGQIQQPLH